MTNPTEIEKKLSEIKERGETSDVWCDVEWLITTLEESLKREAELVAAVQWVSDQNTCSYCGNCAPCGSDFNSVISEMKATLAKHRKDKK